MFSNLEKKIMLANQNKLGNQHNLSVNNIKIEIRSQKLFITPQRSNVCDQNNCKTLYSKIKQRWVLKMMIPQINQQIVQKSHSLFNIFSLFQMAPSKFEYIFLNNNLMSQALAKLRELMSQRGWGIYLLPRTDEHQSEYIGESDQRVSFLSGFTGSNAFAMISQTEALLWTDGRYFLQADKQLKEGWTLRKLVEEQKRWFQHIADTYPAETKIGVDPKLLTAQAGIDRTAFLTKKGFIVEFSIQNLVDLVWENKPNPPKPQIFLHQEWAGKSITQKVTWVREHINRKEGNAAIFNDLSQIAWILNLRSSEIHCNPFFKSILIVRKEGGSLYLPKDHPSLQNEQIINHLAIVSITLQQYEPVFNEKSLIKKDTLNYYIYNEIKDKEPIQWEGIDLYRAVRTQKQIAGFKRCHVVDGIAMAKFWAWRSKLDEVDEYEAALYVNARRYQQQFNKGLSFDTISGGGPNAAVIHYHPTETNHSMITKNMIHLLDSGGQYLDGTTDVTRTYHFGEPTPKQKDAFTRVLLGNLDVERLKWPAGKLTGGDIDVLARRHLWNKNLDYMHGTGHGVGYFEGVHEGPCGISLRNTTKFQSGMIVTNEPGYYEPGQFGIRIQNILLVRENEGFNSFENITICPYDKNLIDKALLSAEDQKYINEYHKKVWNTLSPKLQGDTQSLAWLQKATSPL